MFFSVIVEPSLAVFSYSYIKVGAIIILNLVTIKKISSIYSKYP